MISTGNRSFKIYLVVLSFTSLFLFTIFFHYKAIGKTYLQAVFKIENNEHGEKSGGVDVILVGQARSGTSFLGELLNQHPKVLYIFEPLYSKLLENIFYEKEGKEYRRETTNIMASFLSCNFTGKIMPYFQNYASMSFRRRSKAMANFSYTSTEFVENFKNVCETFQHRTVKVLSGRLSNVSLLSLQDLVERRLARKREVKIVHLVRDPRAVVHSWVRYQWIKDYPDPNFYRNVQRICEPLVKNLKVRQNLPKWLQNRYKFVRYEDMVLQPKKTTQAIYNFLGIEIAPQVMRWVESRQKPPTQKDLNDGQSNIRDANLTINKWENGFSDKKREVVETACSEAVRQLFRN